MLIDPYGLRGGVRGAASGTVSEFEGGCVGGKCLGSRSLVGFRGFAGLAGFAGFAVLVSSQGFQGGN